MPSLLRLYKNVHDTVYIATNCISMAKMKDPAKGFAIATDPDGPRRDLQA